MRHSADLGASPRSGKGALGLLYQTSCIAGACFAISSRFRFESTERSSSRTSLLLANASPFFNSSQAFSSPRFNFARANSPLQFLAFQDESDVPLFQSLKQNLLALFAVRRLAGIVSSVVPDHHGSGAVVAFGDDAFERFVLQRMVFDHDRQPSFLRVERGAFGHSPTLERAIQFQAEIEMEPGRPVQLHHEAQRPTAFVLATFGFRCLLKLAFFAVFLEGHRLNVGSLDQPRQILPCSVQMNTSEACRPTKSPALVSKRFAKAGLAGAFPSRPRPLR